MSLIRTSPSGQFLKQYTAEFPAQIILAGASADPVDVDVPGVQPGQNIVANGAPLATTSLIIQAHCRTAGVVTVFMAAVSNVNLAQTVNVNFTPI